MNFCYCCRDPNVSNKNESISKANRGRNRERGRNEKGKDRGRGKAASNLVQVILLSFKKSKNK